MCADHQPDRQFLQAHQCAADPFGRDLVAQHGDLTGNNRTHMVRMPEPGRFELRLPDGAANPYLLQAGISRAGLDGIAQRRDPGARLDINMYSEGHTAKGALRLPLNLLDAIRGFEKSDVLAQAFGAEFMAGYAKLKYAEWDRFSRHLSDWECRNTLDC